MLSGLGKKISGNMLQQKGGLLFCPPFRRKNATEEKQTMSVKLTTSNQKNPPAGLLGSFGATWFDRPGMLA